MSLDKLTFNRLWFILCILFLLDFLTTTVGVWIGNGIEMNPIVYALQKAEDFRAFFFYSFLMVPMTVYGIASLFKNRLKRAVVIGYILIWSFAVTNNILQLLFFNIL